ncbi:uncharacterized protein CCOS01_07177 [Colletotrichum costaricense]|uniref:Kelch domain-containing protein n=1 Tax=Colletotrichum costaricense TaxID=1209916 RepID=A0AAI9YZV0_9PEZI|nr:uncharacterized protein CCOS01_07177 [Colletotrichum costaricense]KAK1529343.1 hypothetical protein CCOS01_07177 [Colletotrichum costaricense]
MLTKHLASCLALLPLLSGQSAAAPAPSKCTLATTETWEVLKPLVGGPRQEHAAVALGDSIYVVAGIEPDASQPTGVSTIDSVEVYNVPKDECSILGVTGDRIIVAGGISLLELGEDGLQETVDTVSSYNLITKEWEPLPSLPEGREHAGGGVIGNNFYVVGGRFRSQTAVRDTVYVLDLKTLKWSERARMPTPRGGVSVAIVRQRIYTFGGEGNLDPEAGFVFNETEVYDTRTNSWEKLQPMNTPRHGMAAVAYNGSVYTPGGGIRDFGIVDNMEVLHPNTLSCSIKETLENSLTLNENAIPPDASSLSKDHVLIEVISAGINPVEYKLPEIPVFGKFMLQPETPVQAQTFVAESVPKTVPTDSPRVRLSSGP